MVSWTNLLLQDLHNQELGFMIGITYVGCPTCADDIALLSNNVSELQDRYCFDNYFIYFVPVLL
jgi:hypothetical protein